MLKANELTKSDLFRPPYGRIKKSQIKLIQQALPQTKIIMWDVLSADFDTSIDGEKCLENVINHVENGSIIVFHDSLKAWDRLQYALPKTISHLQAKGYTFKTL